jgi:hypothetical protein
MGVIVGIAVLVALNSVATACVMAVFVAALVAVGDKVSTTSGAQEARIVAAPPSPRIFRISLRFKICPTCLSSLSIFYSFIKIIQYIGCK